MSRVRISGWRYGFNKIAMTKTIQARLGSGLAEAKRCTDQTLEGVEVILNVPDTEIAQILARELDALGVDVTFEPDSHLSTASPASPWPPAA